MSEKEHTQSPAGVNEPEHSPGAPPPEKNKRSSFYVYLAVLFGAAFLMLLLAYFVQQRNNATAQSDLRSSCSASRQELLDEIQRLEEEKTVLEEQTAQLQEERDDLNTKLEELQEQWYEAASLSSNQEKELQSWYRFWALEADYLAKDYEACAQFFQIIPADNEPYPLRPESVQERVDEILETLLRRGYLTEEEAALFLPSEPEAQG